ncbi:MAG: MFS transporter [Spirochaetales bacterium]|nr:MFS transporter [Spirochaetales bacterium]
MNSAKERALTYRSVIVAACFSLQAVGLGVYIGFGVFINPLVQEFGWSRAAVSGASSIAMFLMGFLSVLVGRMSDKIGPRFVVLLCAFFFGFGHILMSRINALWQLYLVFGLVIGTGMSAVDVIALSTTAQWFSQKRGTITGIVKVGAGFGQLIFPMAASILITTYSWRVSYIALGTVSFLLFIIIGLLLRRAPDQPPASGTGATVVSQAVSNGSGESLSLKDALRTRAFWIICSSNLVALFCLMTVMVHIVPHASLMIDSPTKAAGILSTIGFASMGGRLLTGIVIDRIGTKRTTVISYFLLTGVLLWLQVADAPWMLYLFAVFYGVAHGGLFTIISPIVADYFGTKSHGALFGIVVFCGTLGGALGPLFSGYIFDVAGSYHPAFWVCAGVSVFGLLLISTLKSIDHRK